jgi:hypothetical protein
MGCTPVEMSKNILCLPLMPGYICIWCWKRAYWMHDVSIPISEWLRSEDKVITPHWASLAPFGFGLCGGLGGGGCLLRWCLTLEPGTCNVVQADLKLMVLPQPSKCWDYSHAPPRLVWWLTRFQFFHVIFGRGSHYVAHVIADAGWWLLLTAS